MKRSEFWEGVDTVFSPALGRSYASDLYIPALGGTCVDALDAHVEPQQVWNALLDEMGVDEAARFLHRVDPKER